MASCARSCRAHNATLRAGGLPGGGILPDAQVGLLLVLHLGEEGLEHLLLVVANELVDLLELVGLLVLHPPLLEARHRLSLLGGHHDGVGDIVELGGRGREAGRRNNLLYLDQWQSLRYLPVDLPRARLAAAAEALVRGRISSRVSSPSPRSPRSSSS